MTDESTKTEQTVFYELGRDQDTGVENIVVFVTGKGQFAARGDHPNFEAIVTAARAEDEAVIDLFDVAISAGTKFEALSERITAAHGNLYIDGVPMHNALAEQIISFIREGEEFKPLVEFYEKMETNPNSESVEHLYKFIQVNADNDTGAFTITEDGNFIAYKGVSGDDDTGYVSGSSGKATVDGVVIEGQIPNAVGSVVTMPRSEVVFDPSNHCSVGLHVGTFPYAKSYAHGAMLKVLINPRDVVSVPNDSAEKMRVCRYKVLEIIDAPETKVVVPAASEETELVAPEYDIRVGDVFKDTDSRREGSTKKVVELNLDEGEATVESKNALGITRNRSIALSRLASRKYKRVRRGRK
jgi:hypothetical protein